MMSNPHQILGILPTSSFTEIKKAYKKLALKYHPDRNPQGKEKFIEIKNAYDHLIQLEKHPKTSTSSHNPDRPSHRDPGFQSKRRTYGDPKYWRHPYSQARQGYWTHTDAPSKIEYETKKVKETIVLGFWHTLQNNWVDLDIKGDKFPSFYLTSTDAQKETSAHIQKELRRINNSIIYSPGPTVLLRTKIHYILTIKRNALALKILKFFDMFPGAW
jgi:hypothetical protein